MFFIISRHKIAELPSKHLEKIHNNNNSQPRLMPRGGLLGYCIDSRHLEAHRATTSSSHVTFHFRLFLGPSSYITKPDSIYACAGFG